MPEQFGDKIHEATPRRRQKAREEGQVARSHDLQSAVLLLGAVLVFMISSSRVSEFLGGFMRRQLSDAAGFQANYHSMLYEINGLLYQLADALLPVMLLLFLVAVVVNIGQVGFLFVPRRLLVDVNRVNPLRGLQRIFSLPSFVRFGFGIFKVLMVSLVAAWSLWADRYSILLLDELTVSEIVIVFYHLVVGISLKIGTVLLVLALLDYAFQRWKHEQDLRMTNQEMREEMKNLQGDPQIATRLKEVQRQLIMNRLNILVPKADVIVTDSTELAVAIQYDPKSIVAPVVMAKGAGVLSQRIRNLALEINIPIIERKELSRWLYKHVEPGQPISAQQYVTVAEVLCYVYRRQGKTLPAVEQTA